MKEQNFSTKETYFIPEELVVSQVSFLNLQPMKNLQKIQKK